MKKLVWIAILLVTAALLAACQDPTVTTPKGTIETTETTAPTTTTQPMLAPVVDKKSDYRVIAAGALLENEMMKLGLDRFAAAFLSSETALCESDAVAVTAHEILIGSTNREISKSEHPLHVTTVKVIGEKIVITGDDPTLLAEAMEWFLEQYVLFANGTVSIPKDLEKVFSVDMSQSETHSIAYADMAKAVYDSFNKKYFKGGWVSGNAYWDKAEMIETYIDVYEATGTKEAKSNMLSYAERFLQAYRKDWKSNEFNDDIMWACIAYTRIALLVGNDDYVAIAKDNFDMVWERAYDEVLGGGLYWRIENNTKNSCVNCPGAIAACLLAEALGDDSYYDKAKLLMEWEFQYMFEEDTGRVYDAYSVEGNINKWASTYNQGTFIGACTYLHKKTGEEKYLIAAEKAAEYAMTRLVNENGVIDNGEASISNRDLPGFKGILVRWLYRYAKYTENRDILAFLQHNADVAYGNRNEIGLIWTDWKRKSPTEKQIDQSGGNYVTFGMSTAVALMYNSIQWW